jgi:heme A synthase
MKTGVLLFRLTGAVLGLQLLLGGLLTFGFISAGAHIVVGFALFALAIATMAVWVTAKPAFKPLQRVSILIVLLLLVQIVLGFATLGSGNQAIALLHFLVALAIFGATISGASMAMRWQPAPKMAPASPVA